MAVGLQGPIDLQNCRRVGIAQLSKMTGQGADQLYFKTQQACPPQLPVIQDSNECDPTESHNYLEHYETYLSIFETQLCHS